MEPAAKTNSGIGLIGDMPWGSHICQFYKTPQDLLDVLVPYFRAGLENHEMCVWVTSDFLTGETARAALSQRVPDFSRYQDKGQIQIIPHTDWYLKGGSFDLERTKRMYLTKQDEALSRGFTGLRVTGNPYWIDSKQDWDDFTAYEAEVNKVLGGTRMLALCTYCLDKCSVSDILDVIKNHEFALAMNQGSWQVVRGLLPG